jgi:general secretion pathway protein K
MARAALIRVKCTGAAIIMAMLLAAFAATIAATLLWQQQRWIGDHAHRRDQVQAQALAMAGLQWARQIVYENAPGGAVIHLGQPWAMRLPPLSMESGTISGYIVDAQGRLNINNLATAATAPVGTAESFARLFAALGLAPSLVNAIADWVDADDNATEPGGAEDAWYIAQSPQGLAANAPVRRVGELLAVRGATEAIVARMRPFVSALDPSTTVNVNTAPAEVLAAVIAGLTPQDAVALVAARDAKPFADIADFRARLPNKTLVVDETAISVNSDWFEVTIEARQGATLARGHALLQRSSIVGQWPTIVWQTVE